MRRKITQYLSVLLVISLSVALSITYQQGNARAQGSSISWDFSKPSDYSYDTSLVDISGGTARTRTLPLENGWWTKTYNGGLSDYGTAVSCDAGGNPVVAGYFNNGTSNDIWVRKYRGSDGATLWTKTYDGGNHDVARGVSCDPDGNPVVAGYTNNGTSNDIWVRKYRGSDGATLWTKTYDSGNNDRAFGVSCDTDGNPVVAGSTNNGTTFDVWVRKYRGSDGATLWTKTYDGGNNDEAYGASCDTDGNPVVAGYTNNGTSNDIWVRKYRGSDGATLWTKTYDSGNNDEAYGVSCDTDGNPVVAGSTNNGTTYDIWVRKYRGSDGATLWTKTYDGGNYDVARGVSCDTDGNPVVTGFTDNGANNDIWLRKYRGSDGATLWTKTYNSGNNDVAFGVSCDTDGNPVLAGYTYNGTNNDIWVRKYPPGNYATHEPITSKNGVDTSGMGFASFSDKAGGGNQGSFSYELSGDGINWYYYSGGWKKSKTGMASESNSAAVVSQHIGEFSTIATSKLYVRVFLNSDGMQKVVLDSITVDLVSSVSSTFYFAEGTCRPNFEPYICIQNPGSADADVKITYMKGDSTTATDSVTVPKNSRVTVSPRTKLGTGDDAAHDFSTKVECTNSQSIIAERPMYFNYNGVWTGGHDVVGAISPSSTFYFAEGTCRPNFEPYICIQNPGSADADVKITYMKGDSTTATDSVTVPKNSRVTVSPRTKLGTGDDAAHDFSTKVECTNSQSIIAERPMYFNYNGVWTGGHDVVGAISPSSTFYFAEGTCRPNFDPYFCIQNPGDKDADVTLTYMKGDGTTDTDTLTVAKSSRATVSPRDKLGTGDYDAQDFSTKVACTNGQSIIAERPMYFNYNDVWTGGHDAMGALAPAKTFYFAEGTCRPGFDPYLCIQNPGSKDAEVKITYMKGDSTTDTDTRTVAKNSRSTVYVKNKLGEGNDATHDFSAKVECTNGQSIIAERPMYFNYNGVWTGGHDVVGFTR